VGEQHWHSGGNLWCSGYVSGNGMVSGCHTGEATMAQRLNGIGAAYIFGNGMVIGCHSGGATLA